MGRTARAENGTYRKSHMNFLGKSFLESFDLERLFAA